MSGEIRVGTSGWHYPAGRGTWNGVFYPARRPRGFDELAYYAERFDTVEINATFYRMPEPDLSTSWIQRTPPDFLFAVKVFQKFTHPDMYLARSASKDWDLSLADVDLFRRGIAPLADANRLAAVLMQFPPSFHADDDTVAYLDWLLGVLRGHPLVVELRHESWDRDAASVVREVLDRGRATRAVIDAPFPRETDPAGAMARAGAHGPLYLRLHGRNAQAWWNHAAAEDRYDYLYSADELAPFAEAVRQTAATGRRVLAYMNNHFSAKAVANAAILRSQLGQLLPGTYPGDMVARYPELTNVVATTGLPLGG